MNHGSWLGSVGLAACALFAGAAASAAPVHYAVFEMDPAGVVSPVYYRQVEMQGSVEPSAAQAGGDAVTYHLDRAGVDLGEFVVKLPRLRGEFARDPGHDGTIESARIDQPQTRAFALRVPVGMADTIRFGNGKQAQTFSLATLAADAPQLAIADAGDVHVERAAPSGPPANRVDILIFGEGYTSAQQGKFNTDAAALGGDFFGITPYLEYQSFVNWTTAFAASAQAGVDHPPYQAGCTTSSCCSDPAAQTDPLAGQFVTTAFDGKFCDWQIHRLLAVNNAKILAAAAAYPDWDEILVIANDTVYGGSGGDIAVTSTNAYASQIVLHEYGHTFTRLADEYDTAYPGFPACNDVSGGPACEANVTNQTNPTLVKWKSWFTPGNPIPTPPGTSGVGLFQGARYQATGMYRPVDQCEMRYLGAGFCPVCRQEYVRKLYAGGWGVPGAGIDLIEPGSESPSTAQPVIYAPGSTQNFSVTTLWPSVGSLVFEWRLDGVPVAGPWTDFYPFSQNSPTPATRSLQLRVRDTTWYATAGLLPTRVRNWTIQVNADIIFRNGFQ